MKNNFSDKSCFMMIEFEKLGFFNAMMDDLYENYKVGDAVEMYISDIKLIEGKPIFRFKLRKKT